MSSTSVTTESDEVQEYAIEEFIRKVGQTIFSDVFCNVCEASLGEVLFNNQFFNPYTVRISLIKLIGKHFTAEKDDCLQNIINEWNTLLWLLRTHNFGKQVFIHPVLQHIVCEMSGYTFDSTNYYVHFNEDWIMLNIHSQMKAVKMCFGDDYEKARDRYFGISGIVNTTARTLLFYIENMARQNITKDEIEYWYNPITRRLFTARWCEFLTKHLLLFTLDARRPIEIQFDTKYHDTMNDKIKVDKTPLKIETLDE